MPDIGQTGRNARLLAQFVAAFDSQDMRGLDDLVAPDVIIDWPQSRERVRGLDNLRELLVRYPGRDPAGFRTEPVFVAGEEPHYVMTPTFNLVRVQGSGDNPTLVVKVHYPDGSTWYMIAFSTIRDDKIVRQTAYFAPEYPAPEWRAPWVEQL